MYRRIIKARLAAAFAGLNEGRISAITNELSPSAEHFFIGTHALSGTRRTAETIQRWYERLHRLLPDIRFRVHQIQVEGPPWRTLATVDWTESNTGTDGVRTTNEGTNVIRIRWGKVVSVRIYTDTAVLQQTLDRLAARGTSEAHADPITSDIRDKSPDFSS